MRKFTLILSLLVAFVATAMAQKTVYIGRRTTTLKPGKQYFISVATHYQGSACTNLLYNNDGTLTVSDKLPSVGIITDSKYFFTVEEAGDGNLVYIKNSDGNYLQADNLASTETKTGIYVIPYYDAKAVCCGSDVDACDANGNKIAYANITAQTPIVSVQKNADYTNSENRNGWRYIGKLTAGVNWCTAFAFYEANTLPELTTDVNNPKWYAIKNVRAQEYAHFSKDNEGMTLQPYLGNSGKFYFTGAEDEDGNLVVKIHNAATNNLCKSYNSWDEEGINWYIKPSASTSNHGFAISNNADFSNTNTSWNDAAGANKSVEYWHGADPGSTWAFLPFDEELDTREELILSTTEEPVLYNIRNARQNGKYVSYTSVGAQLLENNSVDYGSYWYFVEDATVEVSDGWVACKIYNAANATSIQDPDDGTFADQTYYIKKYEYGGCVGFIISKNINDNETAWNDKAGGNVCEYYYKDAGSIWWIEKTDKTAEYFINEATTNKNNSLKKIADYKFADYYKYAAAEIETAKNVIEALSTDNLVDAVESLISNLANAIATLEATEKTADAPVAGDVIQLLNRNYSTYLTGNESNISGTNNIDNIATYWIVESGDAEGQVKLRNASSNKYIGLIEQSREVKSEAEAGTNNIVISNQVGSYAVFKYATSNDFGYGHIAGYNVLVGWLSSADASQWIINQTTLEEAKSALSELISEYENLVGDGLGQYKSMSAELNAAVNAAKSVLTDENSSIVDLINAKLTLKNNTTAADEMELNLPKDGTYLRIMAVEGWNDDARYLSSVNSEKNSGRAAFVANADETTVFYYKDGKLLAVNNANNLGVIGNFAAYNANNNGTSIEFLAATSKLLSAYNIKFNNARSLYVNKNNYTDAANTPAPANDKGYCFKLEELSNEEIAALPKHSVTVGTAGYSTLYLDYAVEIPASVTVYTVTIGDEGYVDLTAVNGVLPANTGVVIRGDAGSYEFTSPKTGWSLTDKGVLNGTVEDTEFNEAGKDYYILSKGINGVAFYKDAKSNGVFLNNANKAYLVLDSESSASASFSFRIEGTTGIDEVKGENGNVKAIYDLTGRRVERINAPGIYIINGKKVVVK